MTVVIIAILASMAVVGYTRTIERGFWRASQDVLQTIYAGEVMYYTFGNSTYQPLAVGGPWTKIYMDDPNTSTPFVGRVTFGVAVAGTTFSAKAQRAPGKFMTIDQNHVLSTAAWPEP